MYYLQSRYYDPTTGRFINTDGQLNADTIFGINVFAYCENNPINLSDPSGNRAVEDGPRSAWIIVTNSGKKVIGGPSYKPLTTEQKMFVAVIAGEAIGENELTQKAVAHTIINRKNEPRDVWSKVETVSDVLTKAQYSAIGGKQYGFCMNYLDERDRSNKEYERLIEAVIPIYYGEEEDFTCGAHYIFNAKKSKGLLRDLESNPNRYVRCGPFEGIDDDEYRMYRCNW